MNSDFWKAAISRSIVKNAVRVSLTVGTGLNLINQAGPILSGAPVSWLHVLLNYLVPYCVSSYSAAKNQTRSQ